MSLRVEFLTFYQNLQRENDSKVSKRAPQGTLFSPKLFPTTLVLTNRVLFKTTNRNKRLIPSFLHAALAKILSLMKKANLI